MVAPVVSDCKACEAATAAAWTCGITHANCQGCEARSIAHSPAAKEAKLGYPQDMELAARKIWPTKTACKRGWVEIWRWIELINEAREKA